MKPCKKGFKPSGLNPKSCKEKKDFLTVLNFEMRNLSDLKLFLLKVKPKIVEDSTEFISQLKIHMKKSIFKIRITKANNFRFFIIELYFPLTSILSTNI